MRRPAVTSSQLICGMISIIDIDAEGFAREHQKRINSLVCAAIFASMMPTVALADDPHDPAMRSAAARARDREIVRQLNLQELARVRERDARYAEGWRAWRGSGDDASASGA